MSRNLLFPLFLIGLFLSCNLVWSQEKSDFNIVHKGEKQILVEYTGDAETVEIPEGVTVIGEDAFSGCDSITSVVIPKGVTKIGDNAFSGCEGLKSLIIPKGLKKIGEDAFEGCTNLTIHAPRGSKAEEYAEENGIPFKVSSKKSSAKKQKEAKAVAVDETSAPAEPASTEEVAAEATPAEPAKPEVAEAAETTKEEADTNEVAQTEEAELATKEEAQEDSPKINPSDYPDFEFIQEDGKTILKKYTGSDENVTIPKGVTEIGDWAFTGCKFLTSIVIPESVTKIGNRAFNGCNSLTSVVLPDTIKEIGEATFGFCSSLKEWTITPTNPYFKSDGGVLLTKDGKTLIAYPSASGEYRIPDGVTKIGKYSFSGCKSLTSVEIPEGVTVIGKGAFDCCISLTSVVIPEGVTEIEYYAFEVCISLKSVEIPESVIEIDDQAFKDCVKLSIQAPIGSKAEEYAKRKGIPFKASEKKSTSKTPKETQVEGSPATETSIPEQSDTQNIIVPDDYPTIEEAYANVKDGGTITIKPGKYVFSTSLIVNRNVTFRSDTDDPESVVIDCTLLSTFWITDGSPSFQNLTVSNGHENSGGFYVSGGTPKLFCCIITSRKGAGMGITGKDANPEVEKCIIKDSVTGVIVEKEGRGEFINCEICGNAKAGINVGKLGTPTITGCNISGNAAGIFVIDSGNPTVIGCKIYNGEEIGIGVFNNGLGTFTGCEIYGNAKSGINVGPSGNPTVTSCEIHSGKVGVLVGEGGKGTFNNNTLKENSVLNWFILADQGEVKGWGNTPEIPGQR